MYKTSFKQRIFQLVTLKVLALYKCQQPIPPPPKKTCNYDRDLTGHFKARLDLAIFVADTF